MDALGRATGLQPSLAVSRVFAAGAGCVAVQQLNIFSANEVALARCEAHDLAVLARSPLAMGLVSGKYRSCDQLALGDVRRATPYWDYFTEAGMPRWQERLAAIRDELCSGQRTRHARNTDLAKYFGRCGGQLSSRVPN